MDILIPLGILISTGGSVLLLHKSKKQYSQKKIVHKKPESFLVTEIKFKTKKFKEELLARKKVIGINLLIAFIFTIGVARNWNELSKYFILAFTVLLIGSNLAVRAKNEAIKNKKLRAIALLFEAIELYMKGGYSLAQSLVLARQLVPELNKEIGICLEYWSESPRKALKKFNGALNLEEGEILVSLLIHIESAGIKNLDNILSREAYNIERLRRLKNESSSAIKPMYLMLYRFLPLIAALSIVAGPLLYRALKVLEDAQILNL